MESDVSAEDIAHLEALIATLRRRQRVLESQRARFGDGAVPPHILLELEDLAREIPRNTADLRRLRPAFPTDQNPYLGLLTFQEQDADCFFGRDALVADLADRAVHAPFLAVLGASGSGKSSVVRAGLIPMLKGGALPGSEHWRYVVLRPGARPLDALAVELAKLQNGDLGAALALSGQLATSDHALLLAAGMLLDRAAGQRLVLVVDQAEELWTLASSEPDTQAAFSAEQQRPFIQLLLTALAAPDQPLLIVLTMRADFLHRAAENPDLARAIGEHDVIVSPMTSDELRDAIVRPGEAAGGQFEPGLVDELIEQTLGRPGALPLLEYTLQELWKQRGPDGTLTWAAYRTMGGIEGALAARADTILTEDYTSVQQNELRQLLLRLIQPGEGAADTRRRVRLDDLVPSGASLAGVQTLLKPLVDERLLTTGRDSASGEETVEVSHEALIRAWPTFAKWIAEERTDLRLQIQLNETTREWQANQRRREFLWSGLRLAVLEAWIRRAQPRLTDAELQFVRASRRSAQRARLLAGTGIGLIAVLLIAVGFIQTQRAGDADRARQTAVALSNQRATAEATANRSASEAKAQTSRLLGQRALILPLAHADEALLVSLEALKISDSTEARSSLLAALQLRPRLVASFGNEVDEVQSVAFSPDGQTLASGSSDGTVRLWDVASGLPRGQPLTGHTAAVLSVAFSPDGKLLASGSFDRTVRLWDVASGQPLGQPFAGHADAVWSAAFSPDGKTLASISDGVLQLWDVASGQRRGQPRMVRTEEQGSKAFAYNEWRLAFSPDGTTLATGGDEAVIGLWDVASGQPRGPPLAGHRDTVMVMAFSPDGKTLASGSFDGTLRLWDVASGQQIGKRSEAGRARSLAFSPDGKILASGGEDATIQLWDVATGQQIGQPLAGYTGSVESLAFSPDGKTLASGGDTTIRLWDVASGRPLGRTGESHRNSVTSVAFSPDGKTLAAGSTDHTIQLWDTASGRRRGWSLAEHTDVVESVAFSPDGKTLASASDDKTILLWDVASGEAIRLLEGHTDAVLSVAFSPDGKILASGSRDRTILLWDVASGQPLGAPLVGHMAAVKSLSFSPDGKTLASGADSFDETIRLWDVASGQPRGELREAGGLSVDSVAFSPDGKTLASISTGTMQLWDVATGQPRGQPIAQQSETRLVFSPDGTMLASLRMDDTIRLWDVATGQPRGQPLEGNGSNISGIAFSPDGTTLAAGSFDGTVQLWGVAGGQASVRQLGDALVPVSGLFWRKTGQGAIAITIKQHAIQLWDAASGQPIGSPLKGSTEGAIRWAISPDGNTLATNGDDRTVRLWDVASGQPIGQPLKGHTAEVRSLAFSPDGKTLASGSDDRTVRLWDVASGQPIGSPLAGHTAEVRSLAFSPDGKTLASISDGTARLWDVASGKLRGQPFNGHLRIGRRGGVISVTFSPDGKLLASRGSDSNIQLRDATTSQPIGPPIKAEARIVQSLAFSPNGKILASGGDDKIIELWDVATGQLIGQPLQGHTDGVIELTFSPDGNMLGSSSIDKTLRLWDVASGQPIGTAFAVHTDDVLNLAFSPDGQMLLSGGADQTVRMIDLSLASWQQRACRSAARNLSLAEWRQYLAEVPYHKTCAQRPLAPDFVANIGERLFTDNLDVAAAQTLISETLALTPNPTLDSSIETRQTLVEAIEAGLTTAVKLIQQDKLAEALTNYAKITPYLSAVSRDASDTLNSVCWEASIRGHAANVLDACDRAVDLNPADGASHDTRGLARALTGNVIGAIDDFKVFVEWAKTQESSTQKLIPERQEWIEKLRDKKLPPEQVFTMDVLIKLREE